MTDPLTDPSPDPLTAGLRAALEDHPSPPTGIDLTRIRTRGRRRRLRRRALQAAATLVVVGGLAVPATVLDVDWPWENSGGAPAVATAAAPDPVLVVAGAEPPGPRDASAHRVVVELRDGCLVSGGVVLVWPQGSGWDGTTREVVLTGGTRIGMGDEVRTSADPVPDPVAVLGESGAAVAARCGGDVVEVLP